MSGSLQDEKVGDTELHDSDVKHEKYEDPDAEFGGPEERKKLEKKLLRKLDIRISVLIVIYILNYVGVLIAMPVVTLYSR
jgi:hypothetical protein